jgi:hypothetical protein
VHVTSAASCATPPTAVRCWRRPDHAAGRHRPAERLNFVTTYLADLSAVRRRAGLSMVADVLARLASARSGGRARSARDPEYWHRTSARAEPVRGLRTPSVPVPVRREPRLSLGDHTTPFHDQVDRDVARREADLPAGVEDPGRVDPVGRGRLA